MFGTWSIRRVSCRSAGRAMRWSTADRLCLAGLGSPSCLLPVPAAGLPLGGLLLVVPRTQAATVGRVVWIHALLDQLSSRQWVVVGVDCWCVPSFEQAQDTPRVALEHACSEACAVLLAVSALVGGFPLWCSGLAGGAGLPGRDSPSAFGADAAGSGRHYCPRVRKAQTRRSASQVMGAPPARRTRERWREGSPRRCPCGTALRG